MPQKSFNFPTVHLGGLAAWPDSGHALRGSWNTTALGKLALAGCTSDKHIHTDLRIAHLLQGVALQLSFGQQLIEILFIP